MNMDNMLFTAGSAPARYERSNDGADALIRGVLRTILGLSRPTTNRALTLLDSSGEEMAVRQHVKMLSLSAHSKLNQILDVLGDTPDTPDTPDMDEYDDEYDDELSGPEDSRNPHLMDRTGLRHNGDDTWTPNKDKDASRRQRMDMPRVTSGNDYSNDARQDSTNESRSFIGFVEYLLKERNDAEVDAELASMGDTTDSELDPATARRVAQAQKNGNTNAANKLRQQGLKRSRVNKPKAQASPSELRVQQKKKELADAIKRNQNETNREGQQ